MQRHKAVDREPITPGASRFAHYQFGHANNRLGAKQGIERAVRQ